MVTPRRFGCFFFKDTPEDSFACFSSSSIQFESYALAADLASDARLQCSSVMKLSRALTWVPGGWSRCDATYFSGTDRGEIPLWCDKFQKLKGWKVEVHLISSPEWSAWNDSLEISVSELNNNEASEWLVCFWGFGIELWKKFESRNQKQQGGMKLSPAWEQMICCRLTYNTDVHAYIHIFLSGKLRNCSKLAFHHLNMVYTTSYKKVWIN